MCDSVNKKGSSTIRLTKPGVINGLQTIMSLKRSSDSLKEERREYFRDELYVLVRVFYGKHALEIDDLVIATNNQNKMNARNLKSNTPTQKFFERSFADLGWFYERKDGAWDAFKESNGKWNNLPGKKARDFTPNIKTKGKPVIKNMNNEVVARSWMAFIGDPNSARNDKSLFFSDENKYKRIFEETPPKHKYYMNNSSTSSDRIHQTPPASNLLLSALIFESIKKSVLPPKELKRFYIGKNNLGDKTPDEQNVELAKDPEYLTHLMMASSPLLFTTIFGFLFLQIAPEKRDKAAKKILKETDLEKIFREKNYPGLKDEILKRPSRTDFFRACYQMWKAILLENAESESFRADLNNASSRPAFMHRKEMMDKILKRIVEFDDAIKNRGRLDKGWSVPFDEIGSITESLVRFSETP